MKVAIFTDTFYPDINGVARTLKKFTEYLSNQHVSFKVFSPKTSSSKYVAEHIHRFESLSFFLYPECRLALPNMLKIKTELESFSPDLIHVATPFNLGLCGIYFAKKLDIPLVGSYHTDFNQYLAHYNLQLLSKWVWSYIAWFHNQFETTFVPSNETLIQLSKHKFKHLKIWSRGVDCQLFHPFYKKDFVRKNTGFQKISAFIRFKICTGKGYTNSSSYSKNNTP